MTTKNKSIAEVVPQFRINQYGIAILDIRLEVFARNGKWLVNLVANGVEWQDEVGPDSMSEHMAYQIALTMSVPALLKKVVA